MKTYSAAPDVMSTIDNMLAEYHGELHGVTVGALFAFDLMQEHEPCLKHQGYPAGAVVRITPVKDRAQGLPDAQIVVDRATWLGLKQPQRDALIDHELTHLERALSPKTGKPKFDVLDRPKLKIRRHDHQLGWFAEVAERHGEASCEVRQGKQLIAATGQLYFPFQFAPLAKALKDSLLATGQGVKFNEETGEVSP